MKNPPVESLLPWMTTKTANGAVIVHVLDVLLGLLHG